MSNTTALRPRTSARTALVAGLVAAAVGIVVMIMSGIPFPLIPPGLVILLGAAALVALLPWRWAPAVGLLAALFLGVGAVLSGATARMLSTPSDAGPFAGSLIQVIGLVVALVAGVVAVRQAARRA